MALIKWYYIVFIGAEAQGTGLDEMLFEFRTSSFSPTSGINVPCNRQINLQREGHWRMLNVLSEMPRLDGWFNEKTT